MVKLNKNKIILFFAIIFTFMAIGVITSFQKEKIVLADSEITTGVVIDMTKKSYYDCQVFDATDFYAELNSEIMANATFKIRYAGDKGGYIIYAVDIPEDAQHFYVDGVFGGEGALLISTDESFSSYVIFDPNCGVGHEYLTFDAFGEEYLNGRPSADRLYFKICAHPVRGKSLQIIDRLRFFHDGTVTEDNFFPEVFVEKENGFYSNIKDLNDGNYRIYGEKIMDTYKGVSYNTFISNGEVGNNLSHCSYAFIDAPYGVYKFNIPEENTVGYEFSNLILKADVWGMFRISISTGLKIVSEDVAAYTSLDLWQDIKCGATDNDKRSYYLDITKFMDSSKTVYIRVTDSSDNDKEDGGAYLSALSVASVYKYVGEPIIDIPETLNSGVVGFPVDLSVIKVSSGLKGYTADMTFCVKAPDNSIVDVNPSGISFTPHVVGDYKVEITATDGNLNKKVENITISVRDAKQIKDITVASIPSAEKILYNKEIDFSGGSLKIVFNDNSETYISMLDCVSSTNKLTKIGKNTIELSFVENGNSQTCEVELQCSDYINKIEMNLISNKKFFTGYDKLDLSGNKIKAYYAGGVDNGNTVDYIIVDMGDETVSYSGYYSTDVGEQILTIYYQGCQCQFQIEVEKDILLSVNLIKYPKTSYAIGEIIDLRDGVVQLTYQSGRIAEIALSNSDVWFEGYNNSEQGNYNLNFEYEGFTFGLTVSVTGDKGNSIVDSNSSGGCSNGLIGSQFAMLLAIFVIVGFVAKKHIFSKDS